MKRNLPRSRRVAAALGGLTATTATTSVLLANSRVTLSGEFLRGVLLGITLVLLVTYAIKWKLNSGRGGSSFS